MDEIEVLRTLTDEVPSASSAARSAARAALLAHIEAASARRRWMPGRAFSRHRRGLVGAMLAFGVMAIMTSGSIPIGSGPQPAAAAALNLAAGVAAAEASQPEDGYLHAKSEGADLLGIGGWQPDRPNGIWVLVPRTRETWIKADGSGRVIQHAGEPIWFGPADKAAWIASGAKDFIGDPNEDTQYVARPTKPPAGVQQTGANSMVLQPGPGSMVVEDLGQLPTDVDGLRRVIDDRAARNSFVEDVLGPSDYERFTIVSDLLSETTVSESKLRSALYRVAAGLNGINYVGPTTDRAGRSGTAVSMTSDQSSRGLERRTLIFDPTTSMLLGTEDVLLHKVDWLDADPPMVIGYTTFLVSDVVASIP